jgi:hypothetical protein
MHLQTKYPFAFVGSLVVACVLANAAEAGFLSRLLTRSVAVGAGSAIARAAPGGSSSSTKTYDETTLTLSQLESCVARAKTLDEQSARVDAEKARMDRLAEDVRSGKDSVQAQRLKVSRTDSKAVANFNRIVDEQNAAVQTYNAELRQAKAGADAFNGSVQSYNQDCAQHYYYVDDMSKVKTKLGLN